MRFLTKDECHTLWNGSGTTGTDQAKLAQAGAYSLSCSIPFERLTWFSRFIAHSFEAFDTCLLWATDYGVWPSIENLHLYYKVRESYGESRLLDEAPGHLFLKYEVEDLATFIQLCLTSLWDVHILPNPNYHTVFLSHDEYVGIYSQEKSLLDKIYVELLDTKVKVNWSDG